MEIQDAEKIKQMAQIVHISDIPPSMAGLLASCAVGGKHAMIIFGNDNADCEGWFQIVLDGATCMDDVYFSGSLVILADVFKAIDILLLGRPNA